MKIPTEVQEFVKLLDEVENEADIPYDILRELHFEQRRAKRRSKLLKPFIKEGSVGAEIGVFWGHLSDYFIEDFNLSKLYLVDPWERLYPEKYPNWGIYTFHGRLSCRATLDYVRNLSQRHSDIVECCEEFSTEFLARQEEESLDWVYLDAAHGFEKVLNDLTLAAPVIKSDGVILGDDYYENAENHKGVKQAVDQFVSEMGWELEVLGNGQYALGRDLSLYSKGDNGRQIKQIVQNNPSDKPLPFGELRKLHIETKRSAQRIANLQKYIKPQSVGAEIGVFWGHFAETLLDAIKPKTLYLVDPWDKLFPENYPNWGSYGIFGKLPARALRKYAEGIAERYQQVELYHGYSYEFYETIPDGHLDWIYIDGNHLYENVIRDLKGAYRKMKQTGVIMGDDYWNAERFADRGVNKAVSEFIAETGYKLVLEGPSQFVLLPPQK